MEKIVIVEDSHGYNSYSHKFDPMEEDAREIAANLMNFWWEHESFGGTGLDQLPKPYKIIEATQEALRPFEIDDCQRSFGNGNDDCQCGHEECPIYKLLWD